MKNKQLACSWTPVSTLVADGIVARVWVGVPCLVGKQVDCPHPQQATSTLWPGHTDGVTHTPVRQPAGAAHIHASLPGQVQLSSGGEPCSQLDTLISSFIEGKLLYGRGVKDST